jgi:hypothetical protein
VTQQTFARLLRRGGGGGVPHKFGIKLGAGSLFPHTLTHKTTKVAKKIAWSDADSGSLLESRPYLLSPAEAPKTTLVAANRAQKTNSKLGEEVPPSVAGPRPPAGEPPGVPQVQRKRRGRKPKHVAFIDGQCLPSELRHSQGHESIVSGDL